MIGAHASFWAWRMGAFGAAGCKRARPLSCHCAAAPCRQQPPDTWIDVDECPGRLAREARAPRACYCTWRVGAAWPTDANVHAPLCCPCTAVLCHQQPSDQGVTRKFRVPPTAECRTLPRSSMDEGELAWNAEVCIVHLRRLQGAKQSASAARKPSARTRLVCKPPRRCPATDNHSAASGQFCRLWTM